MVWVFEQTHGILDDHLVFETNKLSHLFGDPRSYNFHIDFFHVYLFLELWRKLHGLEQFELLIRETPVLVSRRAFEKPCVSQIGRAHV